MIGTRREKMLATPFVPPLVMKKVMTASTAPTRMMPSIVREPMCRSPRCRAPETTCAAVSVEEVTKKVEKMPMAKMTPGISQSFPQPRVSPRPSSI